MSKSNLSKQVLLGILGASSIAGSHTAVAAESSKQPKPIKIKIEKCYGVVKKGHNDCATSKHACAGKAVTSNSPNEWIYTLKGNCGRIYGGIPKPYKPK